MKYLIIFIAVLIALIVVILIIGGVFFTAAVNEVEPVVTDLEPELKVTIVYDVPMLEEHQRIVRELCSMFDLDERLVYGVIFAESNFDNNAVNEETGCFGYMQLNPDFYNPERFSPPARNLYAGIAELTRLMCTYQDANMALLCYNNGEARAKRFVANGVTSTAYTRKVIDYADKLKVKGRLYEYG